MQIKFDKEYLEQLYLKGKTSEKKHRFQPNVIAKYRKTIDLIESLSRAEDLYRFNSLRYEALVGDLVGCQSVRVTDQYRLIIKIEHSGKDVNITICNIIDLTNHYK